MKSIQSNIKKAKNYLDKYHCVAVPTETVYGLAGNAYSNLSVKRIFSLKKRPMNNPLIVHYADIDKLKNDCVINDNFIKLYNEFSPGPITFILKLKKDSKISKLVTNKKKIIEDKVLADSCEALIGSIYLDKGINVVEKFILDFWSDNIKDSVITQIDAKTKLQEFSLKKFKKLPIYKLISNTGPRHKPILKVGVMLADSKVYTAEGSSKKEAEQNAAKNLLDNIKIK